MKVVQGVWGYRKVCCVELAASVEGIWYSKCWYSEEVVVVVVQRRELWFVVCCGVTNESLSFRKGEQDLGQNCGNFVADRRCCINELVSRTLQILSKDRRKILGKIQVDSILVTKLNDYFRTIFCFILFWLGTR